jgi:hypothetical protein
MMNTSVFGQGLSGLGATGQDAFASALKAKWTANPSSFAADVQASPALQTALADMIQKRERRKKLMLIGGAAVAAVALILVVTR